MPRRAREDPHPKCAGSGCHSPPDAANGLDLVSPDVGARLVDHLATGCSGNLADPTDPTGSVLIMKVSDKPSCGERMPKDGTPLTDEEIKCLKVWITSLQPQGTGGAGGGGIGGAGGGNVGGAGGGNIGGGAG
ncbi:hypothetical protein A7982_12256 [Minicystis rosea]|nr:hypothetical protein A7982_12256 [Minicystis rosea]